ncbi:GNAT family N-acetyltransferase [Marinobacter sp. chi1]|uniref:GNAT family N-acetyltransferase n=1 Tax=Marinobacter suaedae TaxID=3057675 RepID=A0ABT8VXL7_9GAMM|nr:GNAT family N-acetyltransferase [Marinobacter sp. chi1]MDO3720704.1 GNAT family N-acetyltransferase [Marinobacter sp. chi1]
MALFTRSVHELAASYTPDQRHAWAPMEPDLSVWQARFDEMTTYVADVGSRPVGFLSIQESDHIELLYTHPDFARQGVATELYRHAIAQLPDSANLISTEASLEARPFFERQGFEVVEEQCVIRHGQEFRRFRMICNRRIFPTS